MAKICPTGRKIPDRKANKYLILNILMTLQLKAIMTYGTMFTSQLLRHRKRTKSFESQVLSGREGAGLAIGVVLVHPCKLFETDLGCTSASHNLHQCTLRWQFAVT